MSDKKIDENMIDDLVALLDSSIEKGDGHINIKMGDETTVERQVIRGCAENSSNPTACSIPTIELPGDDTFGE